MATTLLRPRITHNPKALGAHARAGASARRDALSHTKYTRGKTANVASTYSDHAQLAIPRHWARTRARARQCPPRRTAPRKAHAEKKT
eukprot:9016575-Pyramimonas_sp.AAC.1